ncbi:hypothetical protein CHU98_g7976 [Xylaria longipes]|nr:hypothetical protein CHU98_g7976 [Xylaria longipes]
MSARFQLLLCLRVQSKLLDICMLDNVLTFFENWCSTTKNYENSDPALALVEYNLALVAMSYRRLERAVVLFERALANHEIKSKQHEEALVPLCRVLEGLKKSMPVTQGPSASASKMKFDHKVRVMHAKLSLCEASHCATYTLEAEQLAKDVLAWTKRQQQRNEEEEEGEGEKEEEEQQGENSYKEPTDEQKQTPEQDQSLQSQEIQEQKPDTQSQQQTCARSRGTICHRCAETQMCALNALVLLAQITYDVGKDYSRAVSLCNDALAVICLLKVDLPLYNFSKDEIRLHAYLALSLAKQPGRRDEAEEQAREGMQLDRARVMTIEETMEGRNEKMSYCQAIGGFEEEFGAMLEGGSCVLVTRRSDESTRQADILDARDIDTLTLTLV